MLRFLFLNVILVFLLTSCHTGKTVSKNIPNSPTALFEDRVSLITDSISVYFFMLEDCPIVQYYTLNMRNLFDEYDVNGEKALSRENKAENWNINFLGVFPNTYSTPEHIESFKIEYEIPFPLKTDYFKTLSKKFLVKVTPEVVIWNHNQGKIIYQGKIDNTFFSLGKRRTVTTSNELENALSAITLSQKINVKKTEAVGCLIQTY